MRTIKVALFLPSLTFGGVQRIMINLANGLSQIGCNVTIIACDASGKMKENINSVCKIIDLKKYKYKGDLKPISSYSSLKRALKENTFDFLITAPGYSSVIGLKVLKKIKIQTLPLLIVDNKLSLLLKRKIRNKINYYMLKYYSKKIDAYMVTAHQSAYEDANKIFNKSKFKIYKIYHPLIDTNNDSKITDNTLNTFLEKNKVIISAGRLAYEKNYILLIKAFQKFHIEFPDYKLLILGDGILKEELLNYCKVNNLSDLVVLYGFTDFVIKSIEKSELYVSSSIEEAFGNCIVEALSTGIKIVATDVASHGPYEILQGGKYGRLCKNNDVDALYNAMKEEILHETSNKNDRMNRALDFSIDKSSKKYYELMKGIKNNE